MMRSILPAAALLGAAMLTGCAQTGAKTASVATEVAAETGPFRPFNATSPWNTKIPADAKIDPNSDVLMADFAELNPLHINIAEWSVAVYQVDAKTTPRQYVQGLYPNQYGRGFGPRKRIPIPNGATAGGPNPGTGYIVLEDRKTGTAWEMRQAGQNKDGGWYAGFGATVDLRGNGVNPPWMVAESPLMAASPRPSGVPLSAGLIRVDELKAGRIEHALAFAYGNVRTNAFVAPASTAMPSREGRADNPFGLPLGARIMLDPAYDIENTMLSPSAKVIARALQEYGAILVDEADGAVIYAEAAPDQLAEFKGLLSSEELHLLFAPEFMSRNFRVLEIGEVMPGVPTPKK
ncbi:MAG TPA: hypothetical protein PKV67_07475 [Hyphomonas sp.]|nr:hypothetical protein [Hyphomonas sp.]HRJ00603.1 hypothetical protein [Hyphomonas sp.]HRK66773.1 hypothetical protein [Hyphomonas sp.]